MRKGFKYRARIAAGRTGGFILFLLTVCYIFAALGLFSLGLILFPSAMLGRLGLLTVMSDMASLALILICGGVLLLGAGMSLCIIPLCTALVGRLKRIEKTASILGRKAAAYEETGAS